MLFVYNCEPAGGQDGSRIREFRRRRLGGISHRHGNRRTKVVTCTSFTVFTIFLLIIPVSSRDLYVPKISSLARPVTLQKNTGPARPSNRSMWVERKTERIGPKLGRSNERVSKKWSGAWAGGPRSGERTKCAAPVTAPADILLFSLSSRDTN